MSHDSDTLDTIQRVTTAAGIGFGALGLLTPRLLNATYGYTNGGPTTIAMTRLWGGTLAAVGYLAMTTPPGDQRRTLMTTMAAMNAVNTVAVVATEGLSTRAKVMTSLTSAVFAGLSAYGTTLSD